MSLIAKCMNIFYFLDSCGYYFQRFPLCDNKYFQLGRDTFYIESQIQADNFSCGSYCFEFAKELTEKFLDLEKNQENFNEYIKQFFTNEDGSEFHNRFAPKVEGEERTFGLLPSELLIYF